MTKDKDATSKSPSSKIDKYFKILLLVFLVLLPFTFLPFQSEYFESAKNMLLAGFVGVGTLLFVIRIYKQGEMDVVRTKFDKPILFWFLVILVSTIFSLNFYTSFLGYYSRLTNSFIGTLLIATFFFLVTNFISGKDRIAKVAKAWVAGISLFSLFTVFQYFHLLDWFWSTVNFAGMTFSSTFNPLGSFSVAPFVIMTAVPWLLAGAFSHKVYKNEMPFRILKSGLLLLNLLALSLTLSGSSTVIRVILGLIVALIFGVYAYVYRQKGHKHTWMISGSLIIFALFMVIFNLNTLRNSLNITPYPADPVLDLRTSWVVTSKSIFSEGIKTLIVGSGPETFGYNFTRFKPVEFNGTPFWNLRFSSNGIGILNYVNGSGLLGLAIFAFMIYELVRLVKSAKLKKEGNLPYLLAFVINAAMIVLFIFLTQFTIVLWIFLALSLALLSKAVYADTDGGDDKHTVTVKSFWKTSKEPSYFLARVGVVMFLVGSIFLLSVLLRNASSEYHLRMGVNTETSAPNTSLQNLQLALIEDGSKAYMHREFAVEAYNVAQAILSQSKATDSQKQTAQSLINQAIFEIQTAIVANDTDVNSYEAAAKIFGGLFNLSSGKQFSQETISAMRNAISIDPYNPNNYINLGLMLFELKDKTEAETAFSSAYQLRPDYANGILTYGSYLEGENKLDDAKKVYEAALAQPTVGKGSDLGAELIRRLGTLGKNTLTVNTGSDLQTKTPAGQTNTTPTATPTPAVGNSSN